MHWMIRKSRLTHEWILFPPPQWLWKPERFNSFEEARRAFVNLGESE